MLRREYINDIATHPESTALEIHFIAAVLHFGQAFQQVTLVDFIPFAYVHDHLVIFVAIPNTVDAGNRCHNNAVRALNQTLSCRKAHLLDVLINRRILFNKEIPTRHVGFWLIVVIVRHEILNRVFRKKLFKLGV